MIESGYQIMVRLKAEKRPLLQGLWSDVFLPQDPKPKTLTEISGMPGTGKTLLLYHIVARTVLPQEYNGKGCRVIFVDSNHKRTITDFKKCLLDVIHDNTKLLDAEVDYDALAKLCLESVTYLSCHSSEQFNITMDIIEDLLWDHDNISLLAIDGLDAFYWEDCYKRLVRMSMHYKRMCKRIKPLCQEHSISVIYTVDKNYLQAKNVNHIENPMVDYRLQLRSDKKGERFLNDRKFSIISTESGTIKIIFEKR